MADSTTVGPTCRNPVCARPFAGRVAFCPFCGTAQATRTATTTGLPTRAPETVVKVGVSVPPVAKPPLPPAAPSRVAPPTVPPQPVAPPPEPAAPAIFIDSRVLPKHRRRRLLPILAIGGAALFLRGYLTPTPATARIFVVSTSRAGGTVGIDGQEAGMDGQYLPLAAGTHAVTLQAPGWIAARQQVRVAAGQTLRVFMMMRPDVAPQRDTVSRAISVLAPPIGWSPSVPVQAGDTVELTYRGRMHVRLDGRIVSVSSGQTTLTPATEGTLQVASVEDHAIRVAIAIRSRNP